MLRPRNLLQCGPDGGPSTEGDRELSRSGAANDNDDTYCEKFVAEILVPWMAHEELVFAPASMRTVIDDIVAIAERHGVKGRRSSHEPICP